MRNLLLLLKTRFASTYNINKLLKMNKKKLVLFSLLFIYVFVTLFIAFFGMANICADTLEKANVLPFMLTLFFVLSSFTTLMFTIMNAKGSMFNSNDNNLLLSMPIKPSVILGARLLYIYIWNLLSSLLIILPAIVVYAMHVDVTISYLLTTAIIFLLLPVVPTIIACIIGYIIAYATSKSNMKNWIEMIISIVIFMLPYLIMIKSADIMNYIATHVSNIEDILKWCFYPIYLANDVLMYNHYLSLIIYVILNIVLFILFSHILSLNFKNIISKLQENRTRSNYVMKSLRTSSISKTLLTKEIKRYLSSPIYVLNTSFGPLMLLVLGVGSLFYNTEMIIQMLQMNSVNVGLFPMLTVLFIFVIFLSNTAASSISIEGPNLWIPKTIPVDPIIILNSKIKLNLLVILPASIFSAILIYISGNIEILEMLALICISIISSITAARLGILINLKFPKLNAVNDTQVVKQSTSVMISTLVPLTIIFIFAGLYGALEDIMDVNLYIFIIAILLVIIMIIEKKVLKYWGVRRFKEIN